MKKEIFYFTAEWWLPQSNTFRAMNKRMQYIYYSQFLFTHTLSHFQYPLFILNLPRLPVPTPIKSNSLKNNFGSAGA